MANLELNDVKFKKIQSPRIQIHSKLSSDEYEVDENGNITFNDPVVNAIDIDWNNAEVEGVLGPIKHTGDLIHEIGEIKQSIVAAVTEEPTSPYIKDGYWYVNGEKTDIRAAGENGLTPYFIEDGNGGGSWYIGNELICTIESQESSNGLTPYIKDGYWWIGNENTNVPATGASGVSGNTPYIGDNGNWWIDGVDTGLSTGAEAGEPGTDGQTPYINSDGYWCIGDTNTGVRATSNSLSNDNLPYVGDNGNWWIYDTITEAYKDSGISAISKNYSISGGDPNAIPMYDTETVDKLTRENKLPEKYIDVDTSINAPNSLNVINNLMFIINELQNEITKIKNTFKKGIYSYNGEATYMSETVAQYGDEEEPLWAIEEAELDEIEGFEFDYEHNNLFIDESDILKNCKSNRMFAYLTAPSSNVYFTFKDKDGSDTYEVHLSDYVNCNKCNILTIISRKPSDKEYPVNFIYTAITDYENNKTLKSGYFTEEGNISFKESPLSHNYYFYSISLDGSDLFEKFNIYAQDRTFGNEVIEATPDEDDGTYRVAHIAARTVDTYSTITKIKDQLVNGEFIIVKDTEKLYLKINDKIINIGAGTGEQGGEEGGEHGGQGTPVNPPEGDTMEDYQIIQALEQHGLISIEFINSSEVTTERLYAPSNIKSYKINNIGSVKFVHEDTGKVYEYTTNAYGELESKLIENSTTLAEKLEGAEMFGDFKSSRGFVGQLGRNIARRDGITLAYDGDYVLYADRIKIGAIYGPLATDVTYGCSHAFIELENTSDIPFNLNGCQLHYIRKSTESDYYIKSSLKLTGIIPAGGTYLIRGKKYIENDSDSNCFIHVDSYDQEWYDNGELLDLTMNPEQNKDKKKIFGSYVLILSYHGTVKEVINNKVNYKNFLTSNDMLYKLGLDITDATLSADMASANPTNLQLYLGSWSTKGSLVICADNSSNNTIGTIVTYDANDNKAANSPLVYARGFIDALAFNEARFGIPSAFDALRSNTICRGTYELDPAKQAFNSLTKRDSSRYRWEKKGNDYQYLELNKEYIEFPKTPVTRDVNYYTPKASFEHKNVITDKTHFDKEKPNAPTVSFGENIYTTRCFNWLSASNTNEYVWLYDENGNLLTKKPIESYKYRDLKAGETPYQPQTQSTTFPHRKEFPQAVNNIVYCDYRINTVIDRGTSGTDNKDVTYKKYATAQRACGLFAGSNDFYTSHKCVIEVISDEAAAGLTEPKVYSYVVGQADKNNNPIPEHCSERRYFTMYPKSFKPIIYQITDQQGFHWVEYQVWGAAAQKLNAKIEDEVWNHDENGNRTTAKGIIPIILNTGDLTQSGSRVNEWLDYFIGGDVLFNHLEQNNIVGNNDLNGTDIQFLGTGDDIGKSNPYYFYLFNCVDVNNFFGGDDNPHYPIVNNTYVPSLYYLDTVDFRIVCVNSEITVVNCRDWYNLRCEPYEGVEKEYTINIYTGFNLVGSDKEHNETYVADSFGFTPIYTLLYHAFTKTETDKRARITACHEMPFTVVTNACCAETGQLERFRSMSDAKAPGKLIGSHMNQLDPTEVGAGVHWFSRLLESSGVKLCIGGHKHTYAISYPLREYYKYMKDGNLVSSLTEGPMTMPETLASETRDNVVWKWKGNAPSSNRNVEYVWCETQRKANASKYVEGEFTKDINWSKLPIAYRGTNEIDSSLLPINKFYPATPVYYEKDGNEWTDHYANEGAGKYADKAVTYIMCQATGYKLTSNKELPTPNQKFSRIIPITFNGADGTDTPDNNQKFPMYIKYDLNSSVDQQNNLVRTCDVYLARATNIFNASYKFTQIAYDKGNVDTITWHYLVDKDQYNKVYNAIDPDNTTERNNMKNAIQFVKSYDSNAESLGNAPFGSKETKLTWNPNASKWFMTVTVDDHTEQQEYPGTDVEGEQVYDLVYYDTKGYWGYEKTPAIYWAQEEIDAAQEGDDAYGKTTADIKTPAEIITVYTTANRNLIPYIEKGVWKIDMAQQTGADSIFANKDVYDNYGIWVNKPMKMIDTITL